MINSDAGVLWQKIELAPIVLPLVLLAFALHEMAHAFMAHWFGDPTPKAHGRITLNPIPHLDKVGSIMIVVTYFLFPIPMGFAVTPINESRMRNPRWNGAVVALVGPLTNFVLVVVMLLLVVWGVDAGLSSYWLEAFLFAVGFNALLVVFNLLPIPPLDGSRIVATFMDRHTRARWENLNQYGILILLGIILVFNGPFFTLVFELMDIVYSIAGSIVDGVIPTVPQ